MRGQGGQGGGPSADSAGPADCISTPGLNAAEVAAPLRASCISTVRLRFYRRHSALPSPLPQPSSSSNVEGNMS